MAIVINGSGTITGLSAGGLPDASVATADIADNAITLAKMVGGTDGNIISYDASGDPVAVVTGSSGQVLTSAGAGAPPTFAAAAAGGAWNFISTTVVSGSSGVTIPGLDSTYDTYVVLLSDISVSADGNSCSLQLGDSSGIDSGGSDYEFDMHRTSGTSGSFLSSGSAGAAYVQFSGGVGNATGETMSAIIYIGGPGDKTGRPVVYGNCIVLGTSSAAAGGSFIGARKAVITVNQIKIFQNAGNITGRLTLYGIAHS